MSATPATIAPGGHPRHSTRVAPGQPDRRRRRRTTIRDADLDALEVALAGQLGWRRALQDVNRSRAAAGLPATSRRALRRALLAAGRTTSYPPLVYRQGRPRKASLTAEERKLAFELLPTPARQKDHDPVAAEISRRRLEAGADAKVAVVSGRWLLDQLRSADVVKELVA